MTTSYDAGGASTSDHSTALDLARAAGMTDARIQSMMEEADGAELVADLRLRFVRKGKRLKIERSKASNFLEGSENDEISLYGENGKFVGELSRLTQKGVEVQTLGEYLDPDDCRRALLETYNAFRSDGKIVGPELEI